MQVHSYDSYVEVISAPPALTLRGLCFVEDLCFSGSQQTLIYGSGICHTCKMERPLQL